MKDQEMQEAFASGRWSLRLQHKIKAAVQSGEIEVLSISPQEMRYRKDGREKSWAHPDARWSLSQRDVFKAVVSGTGHLILLARAGAGKTTTLEELCARLPADTRACACAFNKEIERELASRIKGRPDDGVFVEVMTLHSMGFRAVRKAWGKVEADEKDTWTETYLASLPKEAPKGAIKKIAGLAKATLTTAGLIQRMAVSRGLWPETYGPREDSRILSWIVGLLDNAVVPHALIGFDDMVYIAARLGLVGDRFGFVLVDETQDMSAAQLKVARAHLAPEGRMVLIGDDRQAIYAFRGADASGIARMQKELKAQVLPLSTSYRCAKNIATLAKRVVPDFEAAPNAKDGIVEKISALAIPKCWREGDAVVSRSNAPLVKMCLSAIKEGRKARLNGRDIGKEIAALVRRSGAETVDQLVKYIDGWRDDALAKLPKAEEEDTAVEEATQRILDMHATIMALAEGLKTVAQVVARIEEIFADKAGKDVLLFSSTHKAKGLEWDRVFMLDWTFRPQRGIEEENLWYVAVTRAKNTLYLVQESS